MRRPHTSVVLLLVGALQGCVAEPPVADPDARGDTGALPTGPDRIDFGSFSARNLIVVNVDTLRADALVAYGSPHATTPSLDARPGWITVERAVSTASWTLPSTASVLTGQDLPTHGLRTLDENGPVGALRVVTYAELLRQEGFATAMFTGSEMLVDPAIGLTTGFTEFHDVGTEPGNAAGTVAAALEWIEGRAPEDRFFLFLQPNDPHGPYTPEEQDRGVWSDPDALPFSLEDSPLAQEAAIEAALEAATDPAEREAILLEVRAVYDEQILGLDRALEALLDGLEAAGHGEDTLLVLTADHGESFYDGEPLQLGHGMSARNELVHVPLRFWGAGLRDADVPCVASNMDVLPTALGVLGVGGIPSVAGRSLRESCRDQAFSGVYEMVDGREVLTYLSVESLGAQVVLDCLTGTTVAFDLSTDPAATTSRTVEEVPAGGALLASLQGYRDEVEAKLVGLTCPG